MEWLHLGSRESKLNLNNIDTKSWLIKYDRILQKANSSVHSSIAIKMNQFWV